jgi:hypothetical protein
MELVSNIKSKIATISSIKGLREFFIRIKCDFVAHLSDFKNQILYFIPGVFIFAMGFSLAFSPALFKGLLSGLLIYSGLIAIFLARKLFAAVQKYRKLVKQIEARIYIKGHDLGKSGVEDGSQNSQSNNNTKAKNWSEQTAILEIIPDKKTVYH